MVGQGGPGKLRDALHQTPRTVPWRSARLVWGGPLPGVREDARGSGWIDDQQQLRTLSQSRLFAGDGAEIAMALPLTAQVNTFSEREAVVPSNWGTWL